MKRTLLIPCLLMMFSFSSRAQFRGEEPRSPSLSEQKQMSSSSLFGFLNSDNFQMHHSVSMSYMSLGGQGVGISMYTNSMRYKLADNLQARADVSLAFSPFGSIGQQNKNDFSGIFLNRASLDYKPFKDVQISLQYRGYPNAYMNPYHNGNTFGAGSLLPGWQDDW